MALTRDDSQKIGGVIGISTALVLMFSLTNGLYDDISRGLQALYFAEFLIASGLAGIVTSRFLRRYSAALGIKELALTGLVSSGATSMIFLALYIFTQLLR